MPCGRKTKTSKNGSNVTNSIKTLKMVPPHTHKIGLRKKEDENRTAYSWSLHFMLKHGASPVTQQIKNPPVMQETERRGFDPWVREIPWRRNWQPTPVFLPGESHGQRSLGGYSPWSLERVDTTDHAWGPGRLSNCLAEGSPKSALVAGAYC